MQIKQLITGVRPLWKKGLTKDYIYNILCKYKNAYKGVGRADSAILDFSTSSIGYGLCFSSLRKMAGSPDPVPYICRGCCNFTLKGAMNVNFCDIITNDLCPVLKKSWLNSKIILCMLIFCTQCFNWVHTIQLDLLVRP